MKTKKIFKYFSIMSYEAEQEYLRKMHRAGWRLLRVTGLGVFHFEECEPEDVIYQLDYNQEGLAHKNEYIQMFADCGWEHIQDYVGFSYFRKSASLTSGSEEIFCDDDSRLQMLTRIYKGRLLPLVAIFSACLMPQFVLNLFVFQNYIAAAFLGLVIGLYVGMFTAFAIKYHRFKNRINK